MRKKLLYTILICSCSTWATAQQELNDPRYIYSLDTYNLRAKSIAHSMAMEKPVAVYYNGTIYKNVRLSNFLRDSSLIYHESHFCFSRKERKQYTGDRSIRSLYVIGEYNPVRKLVLEDPEYRKLLRRQ